MDEDVKPGDAAATPETFLNGTALFAPTLMSSMGLWLHWGQIAMRAEACAMAQTDAIAQGDVEALSRELQHSLIATTASAFALDAFSISAFGYLRDYRLDRGEKLRKPGGNASTICMERLKLAFFIGPFVDTWQPHFDRLFIQLRHRAIHYMPEWREPVPHDTMPAHVDPEHLVFNATASTKAVDLYFAVLGTCMSKPKPEIKDRFRGTVMDELRRYRQEQAYQRSSQ